MNLNLMQNPFSFFHAPREWIRRFINSVKWSWQRITRGWSDYDVWTMDEYLLAILPEMLDHLAGETYREPVSYSVNEYPWQDYLWTTAQHFMNAREDQRRQTNQYKTALHTSMLADSIRPQEDREELSRLYFEREREIRDWRVSEKNIALDMLKEIFFDLWY